MDPDWLLEWCVETQVLQKVLISFLSACLCLCLCFCLCLFLWLLERCAATQVLQKVLISFLSACQPSFCSKYQRTNIIFSCFKVTRSSELKMSRWNQTSFIMLFLTARVSSGFWGHYPQTKKRWLKMWPKRDLFVPSGPSPCSSFCRQKYPFSWKDSWLVFFLSYF